MADAVPNLTSNLDQREPEASSGSDESSHFVPEDDPLFHLRHHLTGPSELIDPARRKSVASGGETKKKKEVARKRKRESSSGSEYQPPGPAPKKKTLTKKTKVQKRKQVDEDDSYEQLDIGEEEENEADPQVEYSITSKSSTLLFSILCLI